MLPGPVFNVELLTTARRPRYYAFRVLYGLALLVLVWQNYTSWDRFGVGEFRPQQMVAFAGTTFASMAVLQAVLILSMTPALVAGVIANEKQRKTLHYLLSSTLTSGEIVLGKLMARMLHVAVFLAIGLPVMSLLSLFGGVDPTLVMLSVAGTFACGFFLACLSVLCSTIGKKVRDAISMAYALEAVWLFVPIMIQGFMPTSYPWLYPWVRPVNQWLVASTPWGPLSAMTWAFGPAGVAPVLEATFWMMGLQVAAGLVLVALAVARLRPIFKAQEGSPSALWLGFLPVGKKGRVRLFARKPVGDHAMLWKEMHTSRTGGAAQVAVILISLGVAATVGYWTVTLGWDAFKELRADTYDSRGASRGEFSTFLRVISTASGIVAILAAAVAGANAITSEREDDTWISLTATPLEGEDVVPAKILGILWRMRWAALLLAFVWGAGLVGGAIHPLGAFALLVENAAFVGFAASLGTYLSLRSKSSWRSQSLTIGILMAAMGGYLACCCPVFFQGRTTMLILAGCVPFIEAVSLLAPWDYADVFGAGRAGYGRVGEELAEIVLACVLGTITYGVAAFVLFRMAVSDYAHAAGRPVRGETARPRPAIGPEPKDKAGADVA